MSINSANENVKSDSGIDASAQTSGPSAYTKIIDQIFSNPPAAPGVADAATIQPATDVQSQTNSLAPSTKGAMSVDQLVKNHQAKISDLTDASSALSDEAWTKPAKSASRSNKFRGDENEGDEDKDSGGGSPNFSHFESTRKTGYGFLVGFKGLAGLIKGNNFYKDDDDDEEDENNDQNNDKQNDRQNDQADQLVNQPKNQKDKLA